MAASLRLRLAPDFPLRMRWVRPINPDRLGFLKIARSGTAQGRCSISLGRHLDSRGGCNEDTLIGCLLGKLGWPEEARAPSIARTFTFFKCTPQPIAFAQLFAFARSLAGWRRGIGAHG